MKEPLNMTDSPLPTRKRAAPETPAEITALSGVLSPDQRKVRVTVELDINTTRPDLELVLKDSKGEEVCRSTIIENFGAKIDFTLHIRQPQIDLLRRDLCEKIARPHR